MPSPKKKNKTKAKKPKKSSKLDSVLKEVGGSSVAEAKKELQSLLADAKGDTETFFQENAKELEENLVLLHKRKIDKADFDYFIRAQRRSAEIFVASQPIRAQERAERLTLHILEVAVTKIVPLLI